MKKLHVYKNECEWIIAESPKDAKKVWEETCGDFYQDDWDKFIRVPDSEPLFVTDEYGENKVFHTCLEWVELEGRSYLCTTEW